MLGEKITATIKAKYYFGAPVTKAKVKYKVTRTDARRALVSRRPLGLALRPRLLVVRRRLRLVSRLVASGAAAARRPGGGGRQRAARGRRRGRGADRPRRHGRRSRSTRPLAKALHGDQDHQYTITAEVVDESRRTIVGTGDGAGRPQAVQGLRLGRPRLLPRRRHDRGRASAAQTLDHKPVAGKGTLKLLQDHATTPSASRSRRPVETWDLDTDAEGQARQQIKAAAAGPVPPLVHGRPTARGTRSKAATSSRSPARASTARASASTTWSSSPTSGSTRPARRSSC